MCMMCKVEQQVKDMMAKPQIYDSSFIQGFIECAYQNNLISDTVYRELLKGV